MALVHTGICRGIPGAHKQWRGPSTCPCCDSSFLQCPACKERILEKRAEERERLRVRLERVAGAGTDLQVQLPNPEHYVSKSSWEAAARQCRQQIRELTLPVEMASFIGEEN